MWQIEQLQSSSSISSEARTSNFTAPQWQLPFFQDIAGARGALAMSLLPVTDRFRRRHDIVDMRQGQLLHIGGVGHRNVLARDLCRRSVEIVECFFNNLRSDFRADGTDRPTLLDR